MAEPVAHQFLAVNQEMLEAEPMRVIQMGIALAQSSMVRLFEHWNALKWGGYS
jgi:hypothetical protein